ncbi:MAG: histidine kinase dimerization/phosphoacceptor domain -containing protein [Spirochaetota bacterium]
MSNSDYSDHTGDPSDSSGRAGPSGEALYKAVFETTGAATVIIRPDTVVELVNNEFCALSGYPREEVEGTMSWTRFVAPEDTARLRRYHTALREGGSRAPTRYQFVFIDRFDRRRNVSAAVGMIPGSDRSVASLIDITKQKEDELKAKQYSERLRALHSSALAIIDLTNETGQVYEGTLAHLRNTVRFDTASIHILEGESLRIVAARGFADDNKVTGLVFPLSGDYPNSRVVKEERPLLWDDVTADFPHFRSESTHWQSGHIRSWLGVPLVARGQVLGVIALDRTEVAPFSPQDAQLVATFAGHVAMAIHNARLLEMRTRYEEELLVANRHKQTLLQELHHRVKNNMQLISSLLRIRANTLKDSRAAAALHDVEVRIMAMAAVHESLYEPAAQGRIDLGSYVARLAEDIVASHSPAHTVIQKDFQVQTVQATIDVSVPVGLLVSELVLNVTKHAFDEGSTGTLSISLRRLNGRVHLRVADNGRGYSPPPESSQYGHLGLRLVETLTSQLNGHAEVSAEEGTTWIITFPLPDLE